MKIYSYAYSGHYDPAAPAVEIEVRGPGLNSKVMRLTALIDSGADATMLPIQVLRAVGAKHVETRYIRGVTGARQLAETYLALIQIGPHTVPTTNAIALTRAEGVILGRDVLNHLVVILDGPAQVVEIAE